MEKMELISVFKWGLLVFSLVWMVAFDGPGQGLSPLYGDEYEYNERQESRTYVERGEYEDDEREGYGEGNEDMSEFLGSLALWGMLVLNILYYYSMIFKQLPVNVRKESPAIIKFPTRLKNRLRNFHYLGNPIVITIAYLHGVTAEESNFMVWLGWGLMVLLALTGLIMKLQRADEPGAKLNRLIHTQHSLSILMVFFLLVGHAFMD